LQKEARAEVVGNTNPMRNQTMKNPIVRHDKRITHLALDLHIHGRAAKTRDMSTTTSNNLYGVV
jgi:hypothetical protein